MQAARRLSRPSGPTAPMPGRSCCDACTARYSRVLDMWMGRSSPKDQRDVERGEARPSAAGRVDGLPYPVGQDRHADVAHAEVGQGVDHRVGEGSGRADGGLLADAFGPDRVVRRRGDRLQQFDIKAHGQRRLDSGLHPSKTRPVRARRLSVCWQTQPGTTRHPHSNLGDRLPLQATIACWSSGRTAQIDCSVDQRRL